MRKWIYRAKIGDKFNISYNNKIYICEVTGFTHMIDINIGRLPIVTCLNGAVEIEKQQCSTFVVTDNVFNAHKYLNEHLG